MSDPKQETTVPITANSDANGDKDGKQGKIVVCVESALSAAKVIPHAIALSNALGSELQLVHVMESAHPLQTPLDPFEWNLRRREAEALVSDLSKQYGSKESTILTQVLQGKIGEKICSCLINNDQDMVALCRSDAEQSGHIGEIARQVLEKSISSVLIVPANGEQDAVANYQRILIPLDGSSRAEGALAVAKKIAQANAATLILIHAIPDPVLTEIDPLNNEDIELRDNILRRNERVARDYLDRIHEDMSAGGLISTGAIVTGSDPRRRLNEAIITESADLLILSSHGHSGHADAATGDVTSYLIANSTVPVLMIRRLNHNGNHSAKHFYINANSKGARQPTGAS